MNDLSNRFGRAYVRALRGGSGERSLEAQKHALSNAVVAARERPRRRLAWRALALAGVAAIATVVLLWFVRPQPTRELHAQLATQAIVAGETLQIAGDTVLRFSEGSRVDFTPASKVRLTALQPERARIVLEDGELTARITKRTGVDWTFAAGPYQVLVVGTEFRVAWDAATSAFRVSVSEGTVRVIGGGLQHGLTLNAGQDFARDASPVASAPEEDEATAIESPVVMPTKADDSTQRAPRTRGQVPDSEEDWKSLALKQRNAQALAAAKEAGFAELVNRLEVEDLMLLANVARFSGSSADARTAYLATRRRFPASAAAKLAAFSLGRLAADVEKRNHEAQKWFLVYLSEAPDGGLAEGARARLLKLRLAAGDRQGAAQAAEQYLRHHPAGPQAAAARKLASEP